MDSFRHPIRCFSDISIQLSSCLPVLPCLLSSRPRFLRFFFQLNHDRFSFVSPIRAGMPCLSSFPGNPAPPLFFHLCAFSLHIFSFIADFCFRQSFSKGLKLNRTSPSWTLPPHKKNFSRPRPRQTKIIRRNCSYSHHFCASLPVVRYPTQPRGLLDPSSMYISAKDWGLSRLIFTYIYIYRYIIYIHHNISLALSFLVF